jgi:ergothioneine biosynthesis protein EgtB
MMHSDAVQTDKSLLQSALQKFSRVRRTTERICEPLETEDYVPQPIIDVSPPKWHLAHSTWFFETFILSKFLPGYRSFHSRFGHLFNSYYNAAGDRVSRDQRGFMTRPTVREIMEYRRYINEQMLRLENELSDASLEELLPLLEIGCQHEQQHQELLVTDLKYILSCNVIRPVYHQTVIPAGREKKPRYLTIEEGIYPIGYTGTDFRFDNEQAPHRVFLHPFSIRNTLVTNGEYLQFMQDGGYQDYRHWLSEGWATVNPEGWQSPLYWEQEDGQWFEWTLSGRREVDLNAPVTHISFFEAAAFAFWSGKRLLTEFEWEVAARQFNPGMASSNSLDQWFLHPLPAANGQENDILQLFGETWQWTNSAYLPYPGFKIADGALGEYNGKFMMNQMVLRGSSCATPAGHSRPTYRNFFPASSRWQFTGIRLGLSD